MGLMRWLFGGQNVLFNNDTGAQAVQIVDAAAVPIGPDNKLPVDMTVEVTVDPANLATSAKQDSGNTSLASILAKIVADPALEDGNLATLAGTDFATQTTLAAVLAKLVDAPALEGGNLAAIASALVPPEGATRLQFHADAAGTVSIVAGSEGQVVSVYEYIITGGTANGSAQFVDDTVDAPVALSANFQVAQYGGHLRYANYAKPYFVTAAGKGIQITTVGCSIDGEILYTQA